MGRNPKYLEETVNVNFKVPKTKVAEFKKLAGLILDKYKIATPKDFIEIKRLKPKVKSECGCHYSGILRMRGKNCKSFHEPKN